MAQVEGMLASAILENTAKKLRSAMGDESMRRLSVDGCLEEMLKTLEDIRASLEGAEIPSPQGDAQIPSLEPVRGWLRLVRTKAYAIQDMVDDVQETRTPTTAGTMSRMLHYCRGKEDHRSGNKMKEMQKQLMELHKEWHNFGFVPSDVVSALQNDIHVPETTLSEADEQGFVVGIDQDIRYIADMCRAGDVGKAPFILAIFGMGGVGKTTLAKCVYNCRELQEEYDSRAWVNVSYEYDMHRIGESIISQLSGEADILNGDMDYMTKRLGELFNGMKTLLVLDDLQEEDPVQLECLKCMLSGGDKDSKVTIIVTGRSRHTGMKIGAHVLFSKACLTEQDSFFLLSYKTLFDQRTDNIELRMIARMVSSKCMGVPLTIHAIGWILRYRDARVWRAVEASLIWKDYCEDGSPLSYKSMPANLRLCFAYCGIFSKGQIIVKDDLIHQWVALGLIQPTDILSTTQLAEEYIRRLLSMSFLQATDPSYKVYKLCSLLQASGKDDILFTMNDKFHDFAISVMYNELFILDDSMQTRDLNEYRHAVLTNHGFRPSQLSLLSSIQALHCVCCSKMELIDQSFSFPRHLRVLRLKASFLQKLLPDSICQLRHLGYLNLAGCSGLVTLPESIGDLINMFHIDLSGCAGLVNLPQSFGDLINLLYLDLSRCYRLIELPESFSNLKKMEHLDLSFWSCFKGIVEALGGLINVKSLNLSNPCCHLADHWPQLLELKDVWGKLPKLRYLNLSMFLNPIFYQLPEDESLNNYLECISGLSSLEYLDLSHNIFLVDLPESLAKLNKLHTLDISGCARVERVDKWMFEMESLKSIVVRNCQALEVYQFVVCSYSNWSSNFVQLNDVSCKELEISCLEKVKSVEEAQNVTLVKKQELETLKLCWSVDTEGHVEHNDLFGELQPPPNLQCLELHGYNGETCFPAWWTSCNLPNLVKVIMEVLPRCLSLPPLRLLPSLQELVLRKMASITRIDDAGDLSGGNRVPFNKVELDDMDSLEMFNTTWYTNELVIQKCSKLVLGPLPPRAQRLVISDCDQVMSSWRNQGSRHVVEGPSTPVTELEVQSCNVPLAGWSLLHYLPGLHKLTIHNCNNVAASSPEVFLALSSLQSLCFSACNSMSSLPQELGCLASLKELQIVSCKQLTCLPDSMQQLTSLQSMHFTDCESITTLPEWIGSLISLQELVFEKCHAMEQLPKSINGLKKLKGPRILNCPQLKKWFKSVEGSEKFDKIRPNYE
ncbi:hypothetical protein CFC21_027370 [Triticum aestivum]|uniref:NB-ARC domain-containing protein n=2 Tax=Triticum aestivum TaxID=4565 RepID=A0A3B6D4V5_WHEAT|nr:hypothetical protein CFC21_027370 [Triticum aestivum]